MTNTIQPDPIEVNGIVYEVVATDSENLPYKLKGPRSARYSLMRTSPRPELMFVINDRRMGVVERLGWFTDKNGRLEHLR